MSAAQLSAALRARDRVSVWLRLRVRLRPSGCSGTFARGRLARWGREYALGRLGVLDTLYWRRRGG